MHICYYNGVRKFKVAQKKNRLCIHKTGLNPELSKFSLCCMMPFIEVRWCMCVCVKEKRREIDRYLIEIKTHRIFT